MSEVKKPSIRPPKRLQSYAALEAMDLSPALAPSPAPQMDPEREAPMSFNMPRDWHLEFKMDAARRRISMKELLILSYKALQTLEAQQAAQRRQKAAEDRAERAERQKADQGTS